MSTIDHSGGPSRSRHRGGGPAARLPSADYLYGKAEYYLLAAIFYLFCQAMLAVARYDLAWSSWLSGHAWEKTVRFMGQTMFEGEPIGGSDYGIIFLICSLAAYLFAWLKPERDLLTAYRPCWGFILASCITIGLCLVHGLKWGVARARPSAVLDEGAVFTGWYEFGRYFIADGSYRGSLPSGHTATVLFFLTIAYVLSGYRCHRLRLRLAGLICGGLALGYAALMACCRTMANAHWIGDCLFSIGMGWMIMHCLYFWVLRVPTQLHHYRVTGDHPPATPRLWELRCCFWGLLGCAGALCCLFGARAVWLWRGLEYTLLIPPGAVAARFACKRIATLLGKVAGCYWWDHSRTVDLRALFARERSLLGTLADHAPMLLGASLLSLIRARKRGSAAIARLWGRAARKG